MGAEVPRADQYDAKKFIESVKARTNGVPSWVISLKPAKEDSPESLGPDDDLFIKDGKVRYDGHRHLDVQFLLSQYKDNTDPPIWFILKTNFFFFLRIFSLVLKWFNLFYLNFDLVI